MSLHDHHGDTSDGFDPGPAYQRRRLRRIRPLLLGAAAGMVALTGAIVGVGSIASASAGDTATLGHDSLHHEPPYEEIPSEEIPFDDGFFDDEAFEAFDACVIEAMEAAGFDADVEAGPGSDLDVDLEGGSWDDLDAAFDDALHGCASLLPADVAEEMAAWEAFDECLFDAGAFDELDGFGVGDGDAVIHVETPDGFEQIMLGDDDSSVTISSDGDMVVVTTEGDVVRLSEADLDARWAEIDAAHEACADLAPEDLDDEFQFFLRDDEELHDS